MSRRVDYFHDPNAPTPNSIVPSVNVIVSNDAGEILLIRRSDNGNWALPGGAVDIGESLTDAAVRETKEETGIDCEVTGLDGIYTDPRHVILYTSDGEVRQEFSIVLIARPIGGKPTTSDESTDVRWIALSEASELAMDPSMRRRLEHHSSGSADPHLD